MEEGQRRIYEIEKELTQAEKNCEVKYSQFALDAACKYFEEHKLNWIHGNISRIEMLTLKNFKRALTEKIYSADFLFNLDADRIELFRIYFKNTSYYLKCVFSKYKEIEDMKTEVYVCVGDMDLSVSRHSLFIRDPNFLRDNLHDYNAIRKDVFGLETKEPQVQMAIFFCLLEAFMLKFLKAMSNCKSDSSFLEFDFDEIFSKFK